MRKILLLMYIPVIWIYVLMYVFCKEKDKVRKDLDAFYKVHRGCKPSNYTMAFCNEFIGFKEFRSVFYYRFGRFSKLFRWILKGEPLFTIGVPYGKIGGGMFVQHGYATDIEANSIGENFWVNQKVTIAWRGNDRPTIGNNVRISAGAIIIGNVKIGDNVNIGAGAVVVEDIPDNCTVVPPQGIIVKKNGIKVNSSKIK